MRWLMIALVLLPTLAEARGKRPDPGPFARGRSRISLNGGSSGQFGNRYIVIGGGFGYFVAHGFELGLDGQVFFGDEPQIYTLSPHARYVFWQVEPVRPYIGTFMRQQFIDGEVNGQEVDDITSVGGRAGVFITTGRTYIGLGAAYEKIIDCNKQQLEFCEEIYPEFALALSF